MHVITAYSAPQLLQPELKTRTTIFISCIRLNRPALLPQYTYLLARILQAIKLNSIVAGGASVTNVSSFVARVRRFSRASMHQWLGRDPYFESLVCAIHGLSRQSMDCCAKHGSILWAAQSMDCTDP